MTRHLALQGLRCRQRLALLTQGMQRRRPARRGLPHKRSANDSIVALSLCVCVSVQRVRGKNVCRLHYITANGPYNLRVMTDLGQNIYYWPNWLITLNPSN